MAQPEMSQMGCKGQHYFCKVIKTLFFSFDKTDGYGVKALFCWVRIHLNEVNNIYTHVSLCYYDPSAVQMKIKKNYYC